MVVTDDEEVREGVPPEVPRDGPGGVEALRQVGESPLRRRRAGLQVQHDGHPGGARPPPAPAARRLHRGAGAAGREVRRTARRYDGPDPPAAGRVPGSSCLAPLHAARGRGSPDDQPGPLHGGAEEAQHRHRPPLLAAHEFSYYAGRFGWKPEDFPETHFVSERIVSLPLFPGLSEKDQEDVVETIRAVLREFPR